MTVARVAVFLILNTLRSSIRDIINVKSSLQMKPDAKCERNVEPRRAVDTYLPGIATKLFRVLRQ